MTKLWSMYAKAILRKWEDQQMAMPLSTYLVMGRAWESRDRAGSGLSPSKKSRARAEPGRA